ncbi:MAG: UDP-N-acetylenolpyruvoylglucosamine reductase, partial [Betaproteobacteria bacterium]|nr:UDP-N-acetylenolpyruvoylglucosamine reductase [Betaproteobacteria bacterium]
LKARFPELPIYPDGAHHHKIPAAWMIERCGLKGQRQGDVGVSDKHALVLVNYGQASGESLLAFAQTIIQAVQQRFGLTLSIEPRVLLR